MQVAGREFQEDFEPILERQIHHLINYIQGVMHMGQRDIAWVRVSKAAVEKGFTLKDIGVVLHAKFHQDFGKILDKVRSPSTPKKKRWTRSPKRQIGRVQEGRARGDHDRRGCGDFLLLHPVPVFCPHPCLLRQPGAYRPVRRLQLDGLQGVL
jgi:hypothetical protein